MNAAAAVAAIIEHEGSMLATVRAIEPSAGMLDLPGGFVDHGETAEEALRRELTEELGLVDITPVYFGTFPNTYEYRSVTYHTLDLFFTVRLSSLPNLAPNDDVAAIKWIERPDLNLRDFAFSSMKVALSTYIRHD